MYFNTALSYYQLTGFLTLLVTTNYVLADWKTRSTSFGIRDGLIGDLNTKTLFNGDTGE